LESKGNFFILIIVVAVLALTLAALAGYLFIVQGSTANKGEAASTSVATVKEVPAEEDLTTIPLYEDKSYFNLKNDDPKKIAMMQVKVVLICHKTLKEKENKKVIVEEKINAYSDEIQELVVRFFLTKTIDDVKSIEVMDKAKEDLGKEINNLLNEGVKRPEEIVYKVVFSQWLFQ
jgi:flagellar basal body-associated protein FliL